MRPTQDCCAVPAAIRSLERLYIADFAIYRWGE
jgi:hypothetical protein